MFISREEKRALHRNISDLYERVRSLEKTLGLQYDYNFGSKYVHSKAKKARKSQ